MPEENKATLRSLIKERLTNLTNKQKIAESIELATRLEAHPRFQRANCVVLYSALPDEPSTADLLHRWSNKKRLYLPIVRPGRLLEICRYTGDENMKCGSYGIMEPISKEKIDSLGMDDLIVVPGRAFDVNGHRLGRGGGYYDRLLADSAFAQAYKIGYAFGCQILAHLPFESWDIRMDDVLSSKINRATSYNLLRNS